MLMFASIMESAKSRPLEGPHDTAPLNKLNKKSSINSIEKDGKIIIDNAKENLNVANSWESIKIQRFDPTDKKNSKKFELSTLEANKRNKSAKVAEEKLEAAEVAKKDFIDRKNKAITAGEEEEETAAAAGGFANLGELKNIFYKEVRDCPY